MAKVCYQPCRSELLLLLHFHLYHLITVGLADKLVGRVVQEHQPEQAVGQLHQEDGHPREDAGHGQRGEPRGGGPCQNKRDVCARDHARQHERPYVEDDRGNSADNTALAAPKLRHPVEPVDEHVEAGLVLVQVRGDHVEHHGDHGDDDEEGAQGEVVVPPVEVVAPFVRLVGRHVRIAVARGGSECEGVHDVVGILAQPRWEFRELLVLHPLGPQAVFALARGALVHRKAPGRRAPHARPAVRVLLARGIQGL
mmetsp:Transcript_16264/g.43327  ORF Transcript_16264/g.43327 Transcript_16264/m.43327 type:complete len:254 (-) Transcript_16264:626-1387(-)